MVRMFLAILVAGFFSVAAYAQQLSGSVSAIRANVQGVVQRNLLADVAIQDDFSISSKKTFWEIGVSGSGPGCRISGFWLAQVTDSGAGVLRPEQYNPGEKEALPVAFEGRFRASRIEIGVPVLRHRQFLMEPFVVGQNVTDNYSICYTGTDTKKANYRWAADISGNGVGAGVVIIEAFGSNGLGELKVFATTQDRFLELKYLLWRDNVYGGVGYTYRKYCVAGFATTVFMNMSGWTAEIGVRF